MGQPAKYLFDNDFDAMASSGPVSVADLQQEIAELRAMFEVEKEEAKAALIAAKEQSYAEGMTAGKAAGVKEAEDSTEAQIAQAISALSTQAETAFSDLDLRVSVAQREALDVAVSIAKKLCAHLQDRSPLNGLGAFLEETLRDIRGADQVNVQVSSEIATEVEAYLRVAPSLASLSDTISVVGDEALPVGDARIEWLEGQISLSPSSLSELIDERLRLFLENDDGVLQSAAIMHKDDAASLGDGS